MSLVQQYISIVGGFQGCLLFALLIFDSRVSSASKILGVWCLFFALNFFFPFVVSFEELKMFYPVLGWILYLPASYGALLYLYFRNSILDKALGWKDVIFFLPLLVCYGLNIDLLLSSGQEVAAWLKGESTTNSAQRISKYIMFLQAPVFAFITILIIRRYQQQARNTLSAYNPVVFKWFCANAAQSFSI